MWKRKITIEQPWMEKIKEELRKIRDVQDIEISEETVVKVMKKKKN